MADTTTTNPWIYQNGSKYESRNQDMINTLTEEYASRAPFSYDPNSDKAFQDYADIMRKNGNLAMKDTMAKAASMTGGYASSAAQTAGQQMYNNFVDQIGLAEGQFYDRALAKYNAEGNDLLTKLGLYQGLEATDRANWESDYTAALTNAQNKATYAGDYGDLAEILGVNNPQILKDYADIANSTPPTEAQIQGYKNAILWGDADAYVKSLTAQGVNTTDFKEIANGWMQSGEIPEGSILITKDTKGNITGVSNGTSPFTMTTYTVNNLKNTNKNQDFSVNTGGEDWNLKIGDKITSEDSVIKQYGKDKKGLFVYNRNMYYADGSGGVFEVKDGFNLLHPWDGDDLTPLINMILGD